MTKQKEWADIPKEFHNWWDADRLTQTNPFREDSPAYWAWEGWQARAALEQPEQEPVAWTTMPDADDWMFVSGMEKPPFPGEWHPLFTHPTRREWRGLTEEEIDAVWEDAQVFNTHYDIARAIEAALKERNA